MVVGVGYGMRHATGAMLHVTVKSFTACICKQKRIALVTCSVIVSLLIYLNCFILTMNAAKL